MVYVLLCYFTILVCTPVGFARMFTVMGQLVIKPQVRLIGCFDSLRPSQQCFSHVRMGLHGLNQY